MQKKIRTRTNAVFKKIQKAIASQAKTTDTSKLPDTHTQTRYHTGNK
jgi:hypothetical protein